MELNKLCIILPTAFDEKDPPLKDLKTQKKQKRSRRNCGAQVASLLKNSLISFCRHERRTEEPEHEHEHEHGEFFDTEGAEMKDRFGTENIRIFSYSELYVGSDGFSESRILGSGGFGRVYKAVLPSDGTSVAVKCLAERGERFEKTFLAELVAVAHLRHRNLVRLRGWCVHDDALLLVYDFMPNRSLDQVLFKRQESNVTTVLSWERRRRIVRGLATALVYLHEQLENQIVHRDVKSSNVMLDENFNARLGDFGLARWREHDLDFTPSSSSSVRDLQFRLAETSKIGGTIGYLPPESFKKGVATAKSDVFSFGIVVLEVVSGRRAVDLAFADDQIVLLDWVRRLSDEGKALHAGDNRILNGTYSRTDMDRLIHIALLCTLQNPKSRPNMKFVIQVLTGNISGNLPALPSFRSHPPYISISSTTTSSSTSTGTNMTGSSSVASASLYLTAVGETIYTTAEIDIGSGDGDGTRGTSRWSSSRSGGSVGNRGISPMVQAPREIAFSELVTATENFSDAKRVAELDFGTAYRGFLSDGRHILVKRLGMKTCPALRVRFATELHNLGRLRHRNLVQLRGWCTEHGEMLVVYDYSANCLLTHMLLDPERALTWRRRYDIIKSLASAVHYLHEEWDEQVIHRGITSSAVILDPDMNARLGSFALAEFLTRNEHGHHVAAEEKPVRGIFGYMSPEYVASGEATTMADVYSFGVVVLEVITGRMAVDFRRPEVLLVRKVHEFSARKRPLEELADIRLDGDFDRSELARLAKLGTECTASDPESRPSIAQIVRILDGHDEWFAEHRRRKKESTEKWKLMNASSLSLVKRIQALGIQ